jgi:hypothetical protein
LECSEQQQNVFPQIVRDGVPDDVDFEHATHSILLPTKGDGWVGRKVRAYSLPELFVALCDHFTAAEITEKFLSLPDVVGKRRRSKARSCAAKQGEGPGGHTDTTRLMTADGVIELSEDDAPSLPRPPLPPPPLPQPPQSPNRRSSLRRVQGGVTPRARLVPRQPSAPPPPCMLRRGQPLATRGQPLATKPVRRIALQPQPPAGPPPKRVRFSSKGNGKHTRASRSGADRGGDVPFSDSFSESQASPTETVVPYSQVDEDTEDDSFESAVGDHRR